MFVALWYSKIKFMWSVFLSSQSVREDDGADPGGEPGHVGAAEDGGGVVHEEGPAGEPEQAEQVSGQRSGSLGGHTCIYCHVVHNVRTNINVCISTS